MGLTLMDTSLLGEMIPIYVMWRLFARLAMIKRFNCEANQVIQVQMACTLMEMLILLILG